MHISIIQQKVASDGYLHEFTTFVLHPTVNYGLFNFTIMANGSGKAQNSGFSRPHSGKSREKTMQNYTHPLFIIETATLGTIWRIWIQDPGAWEKRYLGGKSFSTMEGPLGFICP